MSAQARVPAPIRKDKVLIRLRPAGQQRTWSFGRIIMKRGIFWKTTVSVSKKMLQFKQKDGTAVFEVASVKGAFRMLQEEGVRDPHTALNASDLPAYFNELIDQGATRASLAAARRSGSYDALVREALTSDLLLDSEDEKFLQDEIARGGGAIEGANTDLVQEVAALQRLVSQMAEAMTLSGVDVPENPDAYDVLNQEAEREETPITEEELAESDIVEDDLPEEIQAAEPVKPAEPAGKKKTGKRRSRARSKKTSTASIPKGAPRLTGGDD